MDSKHEVERLDQELQRLKQEVSFETNVSVLYDWKEEENVNTLSIARIALNRLCLDLKGGFIFFSYSLHVFFYYVSLYIYLILSTCVSMFHANYVLYS